MGANLATLAKAVPRGDISNELVTDLGESAGQTPVLHRSDLARRVGDVETAADRAITAIATQQEQIDALTARIKTLPEGPGKEDAKSKRDSLLHFSRSDVRMASQVLSLIDEELAEVVDVVGNAALDASKAWAALGSISNIGWNAATGDLAGAAFKVAGLFMDKKPDIGSVRHAQVMKMLRQISKQLEEIQRTLNIVDAKVTETLRRVEAVQEYQSEQTRLLIRTLTSMEERLVSEFASARQDLRDGYLRRHLERVAECRRWFPTHRPPRGAPRDMYTCLSSYQSFGLIWGPGRVFMHENFNWGTESLAKIDTTTAVNYIRILPFIAEELHQASGARFPTFRGAADPNSAHPVAVTEAIEALIELRLQQPRYEFQDSTVLDSLRRHLRNYVEWSDVALARSREADGGGLRAFENQKARVQARFLEIEAAYLRADSTGIQRSLGDYCRIFLKTNAAERIRSCTDDRPRLTDTLAGKTPLELARYAVHHGRYNTHRWVDVGPDDEPERHRSGGGKEGNADVWFEYNGRYCIQRHPSFSKGASDVLLAFSPAAERCAQVRIAASSAREARKQRSARLAELIRNVHPAADTWSYAPDQPWFTQPGYALQRTDSILRPHRGEFARWVADSLPISPSLRGLRDEVARLDRVRFAWMAFERLALGACFDETSSNYAYLRSAKQIPTSESLTELLVRRDLHGFMAATRPVSAEVAARLPLSQPVRHAACSRVPADVTAGIDAVGRYLDLRRAAGRAR